MYVLLCYIYIVCYPYLGSLYVKHAFQYISYVYTKILEVNLFAFAYRLFRRDFSPLDTCFPVIIFTSMLQLLALYVTFHVSVTFVVSMKCESLAKCTTKSSMMCNNCITSLQFVF